MNAKQLKRCLETALGNSLAWRGADHRTQLVNSYRSTYFCYQVGECMDELFQPEIGEGKLRRLQIGFQGSDKQPGEWLLDILWAEMFDLPGSKQEKVPSVLRCAVECESSTSTKEFFVDFAKLVAIRSPVKVFLAGVGQLTASGLRKYIDRRLKEAAAYLKSSKAADTTHWFVGFWPSPKDVRSHLHGCKKSLWTCLDDYPHVRPIRLFRLNGGRFKETA